MARRTFDVIDICEIFTHWHAGRSKNEIAVSLGLSRNTVRKYLAAAEAAGMVPGGPPVSQERWAELARGWFPELADTRLRQVTWPAIAEHRDYIVDQLAAGVTVTTIHQRLRDEQGLAVSIASLRRYVAANLPEEARRSQVRVLRLVPAEPGQEAQIDYGRLGSWTDPRTGRRHVVNAFAMVLCCSRHMFVRPVLVMDQRAWTECHVAAFAFFGGVPARLVPDNLKTGVDRPDLYDPKINRSYAELAAHYGCLVDPARSRKPRDKPQVERPMPYIRDSFWRGRCWSSLQQMQADAGRWCTEVAGRRPCRPLDGAAPAAVFAAAEQDKLTPLPPRPFVLAAWSRCKVGPDIHVKVGKTLYSVPWKLIGNTLDARSTATMVQFFLGGELVKTHVRRAQGKQTDLADYPPEKIAFHMRTPVWCRKQAAGIGPACEELIAALLADNALYRLRAAQGVIGLADKHQPGRLEAACAAAIAAGDPSYRTVKGILAAGTEQVTPAQPSGDGGAAAFLHGPDALFAAGPYAAAGNVVAIRPGTEGRAS
jgi:transposase